MTLTHVPVLASMGALLSSAACAIATLALIFTFQTGSDGEYFYLSGVKGPLFLLLASLSVLASVFAWDSLNGLVLYLHAWLMIRHANLHRISHSTDEQSADSDHSESVPVDYEAVALVNGKLGSLWRALLNARRSNGSINLACSVLALLTWLILSVLFVLLLAATVWLHIAIQTSNIVPPRSAASDQASPAFGRTLIQSCTQTVPQSGSWQISLNDNFCQNRLDLVQNDTEAQAALSGTSSTNQILNIPHGFNGQDVAILSSSASAVFATYAANSYGVSTQCQSITSGCDFNSTTGQYSCEESSFAGYINGQFDFSTPTMSNGITQYLVAALASSSNDPVNASPVGLITDLTSDGDQVFTALKCRAQALQVSYTVQSGVPQAQVSSPVDNQTQWTILAPMFPGQISGYDSFGVSQLAAAIDQSRNTQAIANTFALAFSQAAIASSAGIMVAFDTGSSSSASTSSSSITLLPKAPVEMVIALDFVYVLLVLAFGIVALVLNRHDARVRQIRALLTFEGALTATLSRRQMPHNDSPGATRAGSVLSGGKPESQSTNASRTVFESAGSSVRLSSLHNMRPRSEKVIGHIDPYT